jgi:hypothetical protein
MYEDVDPNVVLAKFAKDFLRNVVFYGCAAGVIIVLAQLWWGLGFALFVGFFLVFLFTLIRELIVLGSGAVFFFNLFTGKVKGRFGVMRRALSVGGVALIQLLELAIISTYAFFIYKVLYPDGS